MDGGCNNITTFFFVFFLNPSLNTQYFFLVAVSHSIFNIQGDAAIYILRSAFGVNWSQNIRIIFAGDGETRHGAVTCQEINLLTKIFQISQTRMP